MHCEYARSNKKILEHEQRKGRRGTHPDGQAEQLHTPEGEMRLTTAVHPYMKTRAEARFSGKTEPKASVSWMSDRQLVGTFKLFAGFRKYRISRDYS